MMYLLLVGAIRALAGRERDPSLVLDAFLLRAMTHAGWAPAITDCARCAAPGPHTAFSVAGGGAVCPRCRPPGSVTPPPETYRLLDALLHGEWATADAAGPATRRDASGLVAAHLQYHLERQLRSLPLVERRAAPAGPGTRSAGPGPAGGDGRRWPAGRPPPRATGPNTRRGTGTEGAEPRPARRT